MGAVLALGASAPGFAQDPGPVFVLGVTVDEGRSSDLKAYLAQLLIPMGFALTRDNINPGIDPTVAFDDAKNGTTVYFVTTDGPGRFSVSIHTNSPGWKPLGAEIVRTVESLPYCKITSIDWHWPHPLY